MASPSRPGLGRVSFLESQVVVSVHPLGPTCTPLHFSAVGYFGLVVLGMRRSCAIGAYCCGTINSVMDCAGKVVVMVLVDPLPDGGVTVTVGCATIAARLALL